MLNIIIRNNQNIENWDLKLTLKKYKQFTFKRVIYSIEFSMLSWKVQPITSILKQPGQCIFLTLFWYFPKYYSSVHSSVVHTSIPAEVRMFFPLKHLWWVFYSFQFFLFISFERIVERIKFICLFSLIYPSFKGCKFLQKPIRVLLHTIQKIKLDLQELNETKSTCFFLSKNQFIKITHKFSIFLPHDKVNCDITFSSVSH